MTYDQAKKLGAKISGLFPTVTSEQLKLAIRELQAFGVQAAERAVDEHHKSHEFVNWPQLYEGCRAAEHASGTGSRSVPDQSFADVIRGQWPQVRERCDVEVTLRYWRQQFHEFSKRDHSGDADRLVRMRAYFRNQCAYALIGVKVGEGTIDTLQSAEQWADTIFGEPSYFQTVLDDLRGNIPFAASA